MDVITGIKTSHHGPFFYIVGYRRAAYALTKGS